MTEEQITADVARGIELRTIITNATAELKQIESRLEAVGLRGPHVPLKDAEREGKQAILSTPKHKLAVRLESDNLIGSFEIGSEIDKKVQALLTTSEFETLFKVVKKHERRESDGHKFRIKAKKAIAAEATYLQLIKTIRSLDKDGLPKSKTVIAWDAVETLTPAAES